MTTVLTAPRSVAPSYYLHDHAARAVIAISGMPRQLRATVEQLMVELLPSPVDDAAGVFTMEDALGVLDDTRWFTRWRRDAWRPGTLECREVIVAAREDIDRFAEALQELSREHGFTATVS